LAGGKKCSKENLPSCQFVHTSPTWTAPGLNPGLCGEKPEKLQFLHGLTKLEVWEPLDQSQGNVYHRMTLMMPRLREGIIVNKENYWQKNDIRLALYEIYHMLVDSCTAIHCTRHLQLCWLTGWGHKLNGISTIIY